MSRVREVWTRVAVLAACLGLAAGQATVYIDVSGGEFASPFYTFSPSLPTMLEAGTTYVFTAAGIGTNHPFRVGTARGTTPAWVTGTTTGFTGTGDSLTVAIPSGYAGSNVVLYCNNHVDMTLTRLVRAIPTGASCSGNTLDQHWILASYSQTCVDACAAVGRTCVPDTDHATTETCVHEISSLPSVDRPCVTYSGSTGPINPTIYDNAGSSWDVCYYYTGSDPHVDCAITSTSSLAGRLCPCTPDSPPPLTPPSPPPPSPPPPSPSTPVCSSGVLDNTWVQADDGQDCTAACADANLACVEGAPLPTLTSCLQALVATLPTNPCGHGFLPFNNVNGAPYVWNYDLGYCYAAPLSDATQSCAISQANYSRFCACGPHSPPLPSMPPSPPPMSAHCIDGYWPLFTVRIAANNASPSDTSHAHVFGSRTYYMPDGVPGAQHDEAGDGSCPSHALLYSPSTPPPPSPSSPPASPPLACPVSEATCTDHGADEAAATAACAGNPLCYVVSTLDNDAATGCGIYALVGTPNQNALNAGRTVDEGPGATCEDQGMTTIDSAAACEFYADNTAGTSWGAAVAFTSAGRAAPHCFIYWTYSGSNADDGKVYYNSGASHTCDATGNLDVSAGCVCCAGDRYRYESCLCPSPPASPSPPLRPLGDNALCIKGDSPLFASQADANAHSPDGTSTATSWDLGNGVSYWKPDGYPWATSTGGATCLEGTALVLIPIHILPKQTCGGGALSFADKYPYATASEAATGCNLHGCGGGLAPASALNSSWYAWTGNGASNGRPTSVQDECYAAWYINDIGFVGDSGGTVHTHDQLYFMHSSDAGCGSQGLNHWLNNPVDSAAACLGCDYHFERCPSPPPTSPPPPTLPPPPEPPTTPPPATPSVAEPISPLAVIGIVVGGLVGSLLLAMLLICACAGPVGYAAQKLECDNPPNRYTEPKKFKDWQQHCDELNQDEVERAPKVGRVRFKL